MIDLAAGGEPVPRTEIGEPSERLETPSGAPMLALLTFAVLFGTYFVARSGGHWAESDTAAITGWIRSVVASGTLTPTTGDVYPQGYGYAAVSAFVLALTGLDVATLQQIVYPLVSALLVLPSWTLYRELTGSRRAATLATLLLFVQPEFLFVVMRGSHERLLRALMLVSLWLLARSFRVRARPASFAVHVALFYVAAYALIATNVLFGVSFFVAIASAMLAAWVLGRINPALRPIAEPTVARLASVTLVAAGLGFVVIFYAYPISQTSLHALGMLAQKVGGLYLTTSPSATAAYDPYAAVVGGWVSLPVYFLVSCGDYVLLMVSAGIWIRRGIQRPWRHLSERRAFGAWILWLLYGAFAMQGALAILSDRTGFLGGNLQDRSFPSFAMVATPMVAAPLAEWRPRPWASAVFGCAIVLLAGTALLKATNEPALSNKWTFYTAPEIQALRWADAHDRNESIWVGLDERLSTAYAIAVGPPRRGNDWDEYTPKPATRAFVISDVTRLRSARLANPLPPVEAENQIYDSGPVQVYRLRQRTPYQR